MSSTEELIEAVHHQTVLYDTSHPDYMRGTYKDEIWAHIACILQLKDAEYRLLLYENCKYDLEIRFSVDVYIKGHSESDYELRFSK